MTACLYCHPDGYTNAGRPIMGHHAAGSSFLLACLEQSRSEDLWFQVEPAAHVDSFRQIARQQGRREPIQAMNPEPIGSASAGPGPEA